MEKSSFEVIRGTLDVLILKTGYCQVQEANPAWRSWL